MPRRNVTKKRSISLSFGGILALVSIVGFLEIVSDSFFKINFGEYIVFLWLTLMGIGFIIQSNPKKLLKKKKDDTINNITSLVIGSLAIIAGVLSLPFIGISHPVFLATKGVIALIAIIFIILETWIIKE